MKNLDGEHVWHVTFGSDGLDSSHGTTRNFRMNFLIQGTVKLDDAKAFDKLQAETEAYLQKPQTLHQFDAIIQRLIASSFYFKPLKIETQSNGVIWVKGKQLRQEYNSREDWYISTHWIRKH